MSIKVLHTVVLALVATSTAFGQRLQIDIQDGAIVLVGDAEQLAGINIKSKGGYLNRAPWEVSPGVLVPNQSHEPFAFGTASFAAQTAHEFAYGILGAANAIDISGVTRTAVMYGESREVACGGDLTVALGLVNISTPTSGSLCVPEPNGCSVILFGIPPFVALRRRRPMMVKNILRCP